MSDQFTPPQATLQFLGAANTVTGSRYLLEIDKRRVLIDCGMFQGYKYLRERNWAAFPVDPATIEMVLLTHAHIDHSGYLPALVKQGFKGKVYCTAASRELCAILLPDSGYLLEEQARYARKKGYSKHANPEPLYTRDDAEACLKYFRAHDFEKPLKIMPGVSARFLRAGHILGAAQISLDIHGRTLHFSGDMGRPNDPLMKPPVPLVQADVLVCESTYGDRVHPEINTQAELAPIISRVAARGGVVVIPAFAVGRAQILMLQIARLQAQGLIPKVPVYLNSPMAIDATEIYRQHHDEHNISEADCRLMTGLATMVHSAEESKTLNMRSGPMIIISASGMATGGRVLHHIEAFGPDPRNAIVLAGYQAGGTRGALLAGGAKSVRMFGREVPINAEVLTLQSFSSHADSNELIAWMRTAQKPPGMTYITHGEPDAADILRGRVKRELGWTCRVPEQLEQVQLFAQTQSN